VRKESTPSMGTCGQSLGQCDVRSQWRMASGGAGARLVLYWSREDEGVWVAWRWPLGHEVGQQGWAGKAAG
jgi:hypothetical protein